MVIRKKLFKIVDTLLGRNKQTTLPKYDSPLTMASVMNKFFIDKIDNIRAEFPLFEANLPCYSFLSMDYIMPICTTTFCVASLQNSPLVGRNESGIILD